MKIALDRVDTAGLRVELPGDANEAVGIASTTNLRGSIRIDGAVTTVQGLTADEVVLSALHLVLGSLVLSSPSGGTLRAFALSLRSAEALAFEAKADVVAALDLTVSGVAVRGRVTFGGARLTVNGDDGALEAERFAIEELSLRLDGVDLTADTAKGTAFVLRWSATSFRIAAASLTAPALAVVLADARVTASGVDVTDLVVADAGVDVGRAAFAGLHVHAKLATDPVETREQGLVTVRAEEPGAPVEPGEPLVDWRVLDGLSGQLDVDAAVDLTVPVIGHRKATHHLRIAIERGSIDFRAFERNLARLEDALLDFTVRDSAFVLERANPLFPVRGHGTPVVVWALQEGDLELVNADRVRLSLLPHAELVASDPPKDPDVPPAKSPIALRQLGLLDISARLALAAPERQLGGQLRPKRLGSLALQGSVLYDPGDDAPPGSLRGSITDLAVSLHRLAVGSSVLDIADAQITAVPVLEVAFADITPTELRLETGALTLTGIALRDMPAAN